MKALILTQAVETNTRGDFAHGQNVVELLLRQKLFSELVWVQYHRNHQIKQDFEQAAKSIRASDDTFDYRVCLESVASNGQIKFYEACFTEFANFDVVILVASQYASNFRTIRYFKDLVSRHNMKAIHIEEYDIKKHNTNLDYDHLSLDCIAPTIETGLRNVAEGVFTAYKHRPLITDKKIDGLASLIEFCTNTETKQPRSEIFQQGHFAYFHSSAEHKDDYLKFIQRCLVISKVEGRKTTLIICNKNVESVCELGFEKQPLEGDEFETRLFCNAQGEKLLLINPFPLNQQEFQFLLKNTHLVCGVTGDSSFIEALNDKKIPIHDCMVSKELFYKSFVELIAQSVPDCGIVQALVNFMLLNSTEELHSSYNLLHTNRAKILQILEKFKAVMDDKFSLEKNLAQAINSRLLLAQVVQEEAVKFLITCIIVPGFDKLFRKAQIDGVADFYDKIKTAVTFRLAKQLGVTEDNLTTNKKFKALIFDGYCVALTKDQIEQVSEAAKEKLEIQSKTEPQAESKEDQLTPRAAPKI